MTDGRFRTVPSTGATTTFLMLLALLPLIGAQFGYGNQIEQILIAERLRDPSFAANDMILANAAGFGPRIYYARVLAAAQSVLPLPVVIHAGMVVFSLLLAWVAYATARRVLGAGWIGAGLAAIMAVANGSFSLGLAGYLRFDSFQPANPAVALAFLGVLGLLLGRVWLTLPAFVLAGLFHPLIGAEVATTAYAAVFLAVLFLPRGPNDPGTRALPVILSGLAFCAAMVAIWAVPTFGVNTASSPSPVFDILVAFRAPHHYLGLGFPRRSWLIAALFVAAVLVVIIAYLRERGLSRGVAALILMASAILALCLASLYFVDIAHSDLWSTAQVFRMLMIVKWVGFLFLGWFFGRAIVRHGLPAALIVGLASLATADAHGYAAAIAVAALLTLAAMHGRVPVVWVVTAVASLAIAYYLRRFGLGEQSARAALGLALLCLLASGTPLRQLSAVAITAVSLSAMIATRHDGLLGWYALRAQYSWSDLTDADHRIARAAGQVSPEGAIWVVPPRFETFRILARRAVVVDFTTVPFDGADLIAWRTRIEALYGPVTGGGFVAQKSMDENYRNSPGLEAAARDYGATFAVLYKDTPWNGPVLAENETYMAIPIGPGTN